MTAEAAFTRTWHVGSRTVQFSVPRPKPGQAVHCSCEWSPDAPVRMTPGEWQQYRAGRDACLSDLAAELGVTVAVIDA